MTPLERTRTSLDRASIPELTPSAELALLARALHNVGYDDPVVGHATYRIGRDYLTLPRELGWDEVRASDVLRIDAAGNKLDGQLTVPTALKLHMAVHRIRPGCNITIHQHPLYSTAWAATGSLPPAYDQRSVVAVSTETNYYDDYPGNVSNQEAADEAANAIGSANYTFLRNHGVFVIADDIRQAYTRAAALEWRSRMAWLVHSLGEGRVVPPRGEAAITSYLKARGEQQPHLWEWAVRRELSADPSVLE